MIDHGDSVRTYYTSVFPTMYTLLVITFGVAAALAQASPEEYGHNLRRRQGDVFLAGMALQSDDGSEDNNFKSIAATFTLPDVTHSISDHSKLEFISPWVGLGGVPGADVGAMIEAGADVFCGDTCPQYTFWWEWYASATAPPAVYLAADEFSGKAGEKITVIINKYGSSNYTIDFTNTSTKQHKKVLDASAAAAGFPGTPVTGMEAQFMLERTSKWVMPGWDTITFSDATAMTVGDKKLVVGDASGYSEFVVDGKTVTKTTVEGTTMQIHYIS